MSQLVVGENSFISVAEADNIISDTYISISDERKFWDGLSTEDKSTLLIDATSKLNNEHWMWIGVPLNSDQSLVFPRQDNENYDTINIDNAFKRGLCELALFKCSTLMSENNKMLSAGITSYKIKDCSVSFDSDAIKEFSSKNDTDDVPYAIFDKYFIHLTYLNF